MLGIAVTFIVCLVVRVSAAIRPGLPACIVVLFSGAGLKDYFSLQARLLPRHSAFYNGRGSCVLLLLPRLQLQPIPE